MDALSRRRFLQRSGFGLAAATGYFAADAARGGEALEASPLGLPIGLQLYTVRDLLAKDYDGTIRAIGKLGYQEVELFGDQTRKPEDLKALFKSAGLRAASMHVNVPDLQGGKFDEKLAFAKALGVEYVVLAFPALKDPSRITPTPSPSDGAAWFQAILKNINLDDFRWIADISNKAGEQAKAAGLQFAYHNHNLEFRVFDGVIAYDEMLQRFDPQLVKLEMDCGWVFIAGEDPADYLARYPGRIPLLHVKDVKKGVRKTTTIEGDAPTTPVGMGTVDWKRLFAAAKASGVKHYFVEQETFDGPPLDALRASVDYLKALKA